MKFTSSYSNIKFRYNGLPYQFKDGIFETDDKVIIEYLSKQSEFKKIEPKKPVKKEYKIPKKEPLKEPDK